MSGASKKALLDTDFLFKSLLAQNSNQEPLADRIIHFANYDFFCHEKIIHELKEHRFNPDPLPWLEAKMKQGLIKQYTDQEIVDEMENMFGKGAPGLYFDMLKKSCDAFNNPSELPFFETYYQTLIDLPDDVSKEEFLKTLAFCDAAIPNGNSMGEKKSLVLAQLIQLKCSGRIVIFCSDDSKARQRVVYIGNQLRCLSILSIFQKLLADGLDKQSVREYYDSFCSFLSLHDQTAMKVWTHSTCERISVDFNTLFEEIYAGKFEIKGTGDLRYRK